MTELIKEKLKEIPIIREMATVIRDIEGKVYLVGGAVRDLIIAGAGTKPGKLSDIDIAVEGEPVKISALMARKIRGSSFPVDVSRNIWRVVPPKDSLKHFSMDIVPLKEGSVLRDLKARDFSINSIAVDLRDLFLYNKMTFIDPCNGIKDIREKKIRVDTSLPFDEDPLRLLRAVRFEELLGFGIEKNTISWLTERADKISNVSGERVRIEIVSAVSQGNGARFFRRLKELGLLKFIAPELEKTDEIIREDKAEYNLFEHSIATMEAVQNIIKGLPSLFKDHYPKIIEILTTRTEEGITQADMLKLCALMHHTDKAFSSLPPQTDLKRFNPAANLTKNGINLNSNHSNSKKSLLLTNRFFFKKLKLSRSSTKTASLCFGYHTTPLNFTRLPTVSNSKMHSFFRETGQLGPLVCLLSLADAQTSKWFHLGQEFKKKVRCLIIKMISYYYNEYMKIGKPLLTGRELIKMLNLKPGPSFKNILIEIEEKRADGIINSQDEALRYVEQNRTRIVSSQ